MKNNILPFLDKKTEAVYRALLNLADASASRVAQKAEIKRTSAYHLLENLISMGLASSYKESGVKRFVAEHPSKLKAFFERQTVLAERLIPELEKEILRGSKTPTVRIFEGKEAVKSTTEQALKTKEKTILTIGSSQKLLKILGGKYGWGERRRKLGVLQRALRFPEDETVDSPSRLHSVRILPASFKFPGYILIFDNSIATILFANPPLGILITDPNYSLMIRSIFEVLWNNSTPLNLVRHKTPL